MKHVLAVAFLLFLNVAAFAQGSGGPAYSNAANLSNATGTLPVANGGTASITASAALVNLGIEDSTNQSVLLPVGTTGARPTPVEGMLRDNTTTPAVEAYLNGTWQTIVSGSSMANAVANLFGSNIYYVRNYGLKCDGQYITVTTTASTAAIVSTHTFTSADIGKMISIPYASAVTITGNTHTTTTLDTLSTTQPRFVGQTVTGSDFAANTTIANVLSTSSVQLSQAATGTHTGTSVTFGYPLNTTIASVSGGAATLTVAPTISLTSSSTLSPSGNAAAFGTGDATAFNSLISTITAASGAKVILQGMCILDATVTWASNISLVGDGNDVSGVKFISTSDLTNNVLQGSGTSGTHMVANTFRDFFIDGWSATQATYNVFGKGLNMPYAEGFYAENIHVYGTPATCLANDFPLSVVKHANKLVRCGRLASAQIGGNGIGDGISSAVSGEMDVATDNIIIDPTNYGIFLEAQTATAAAVQGSFTNNHVFQSLNPPSNSNGSAGLANSGGIGFVINDNTVTCTGLPSLYAGVGITPGTTAQTSGTQTVVSGNQVTGCFRGVVVDYIVNALPNGTPSKIIIASNQLVGEGVSSSNSSDGIYIRPNASQTMDTLSLIGNTISLYGRCGTLATGTGTLKQLMMSGNTISNNSQTNVTSQFQSGVCFNATTTGLTMVGNNIFDNATGTQKYGMSISSGITVSGAVLSSNNMDGNATSPFNIVGTLTGTDLYTTNSGAVGIGTATPRNSSTLDVNGTINVNTVGSAAATPACYSTSSGGVLSLCTGTPFTTAGTGLSNSGATINSNAVYQVSFQPGLVASVTNTKSVYAKLSKASTVDNIEGAASAFSCVSNPTVTFFECGVSSTCASSPTTIGTVTITAAGQVFDGTVNSAAITAGDYIAWAITAGTCTSLDISTTAQVHSN